MVNIYLRIQDRQVLALSIPLDDIKRLSICPVKWLRFVTFAICGARGDLSVIPNGPPVDYASILLDHVAEAYHYTPEGDYHFIDYNGMDDRITSSEQTPRSSCFRRNVMARDGPACAVTRAHAVSCDAAHLLSKSKGDEYIRVVLQDRLNLYDPTLEPGVLGIDSVENGIFLAKTLHGLFGQGHCAFLKTPNFALDPADIPRVETDPMPSTRITLHHLEPDPSLDPILQRDVHMAGTGISPPPAIILDFVYGVAAYRRWRSGHDIKEVMRQRFVEHYKSIPIPPATSHSSDSDSSLPQDPNDSDYIPNKQPRRRHYHSKMSDDMLRAMDDVLALSMLMKGTTPEIIAAERQRLEEAEEVRAKEASRVKVQQWMKSSSCVLSYLQTISQESDLRLNRDTEFQSNTASMHYENPTFK